MPQQYTAEAAHASDLFSARHLRKRVFLGAQKLESGCVVASLCSALALGVVTFLIE